MNTLHKLDHALIDLVAARIADGDTIPQAFRCYDIPASTRTLWLRRCRNQEGKPGPILTLLAQRLDEALEQGREKRLAAEMERRRLDRLARQAKAYPIFVPVEAQRPEPMVASMSRVIRVKSRRRQLD